MSLFSNMNLNGDENAHWMSSPPNNGSENAGVSGSTSPHGSCPPGFDPAVARPSSGLSGGTPPSSSQLGLLNTNYQYQPSTGPDVALSKEDQFHCKVCNVNFSGSEPARQHYAGKQHRKALQAQEAGKSAGDGSTFPLECTICQKMFTGQSSAKQHFESSKHKTAVAGATVWAQKQGQAGTVSQGVGQHTMPSNDAAPDVVSNQHPYQRSPPGALLNLGAFGGDLLQPMGSTPVASPSISAADFTAAVGPGNQQLRQHIAKVCSSVLERYLMQLIPDLSDKITDKVLEELSKAPPVDASGRESAARASPRQNGSAEERLESISTDYRSMPSLVGSLSLNSMDMRGAGKSSSEAANIRSNLKQLSHQYSGVWDSLTENKK